MNCLPGKDRSRFHSMWHASGHQSDLQRLVSLRVAQETNKRFHLRRMKPEPESTTAAGVTWVRILEPCQRPPNSRVLGVSSIPRSTCELKKNNNINNNISSPPPPLVFPGSRSIKVLAAFNGNRKGASPHPWGIVLPENMRWWWAQEDSSAQGGEPPPL